MEYISVCSGIEAATMAFHDLGWKPLAFSEIEPFPAAVLAHHYPDVINEGDFTTIGDKYDLTDGLLCGGTPCQDYSIAGLRAGLAGERGSLSTDFIKLAYTSNAKWVLWENVPGVLSSGSGRDFATILSGFTGCRIEVPEDGWKSAGVIQGAEGCYSIAWRILDAQYFGLAQRRRRVFAVAVRDPRGWQYPASVLLNYSGLLGDFTPRREARKGAAQDVAGSLGKRGTRSHTELDGHGAYIPHAGLPEVMCSLRSSGAGFDRPGNAATEDVTYIPQVATAEICPTLQARDYKDINSDDTAMGGKHVVLYENHANDSRVTGPHDTAPAMTSRMETGGGNVPFVQSIPRMQVRRLTPRECERLQGFPDDFTRIPYRNKPADKCPDGPRYKALGNSMAVLCMKWLGERIQMVENIEKRRESNV